MKDTPNLEAEQLRITMGPADGNKGAFAVGQLRVIVSDGRGWDHVSVSLPNRVPTWGEMCRVKRLFFKAEETVVQLHPPESKYIDLCQHCLHLWRPQDSEIRLPPPHMV